MMINIEKFLEILEEEIKTYNVPVIDLIATQENNPFKILVGTILSARTKDDVTARAIERLFDKISDAKTLMRLSAEEIEKLIYPVGFYKNKARYLTQLPEALKRFNNEVPDDMESLLSLPGVGRKTANLVLSMAFEIPAICVDTHVHRIVNLWGYVKTKTPLETEMELRKKLPEKLWLRINSILVAFGQGTCRPVAPHCEKCILNDKCPKIGVKPAKTRIKPKSSNSKKIYSWNVNGIRAVEKKGFIDILKNSSADIFSLQETKANPSQLSEALLNIDGYHSYFVSAQKKGYSGVAVYSKIKPINVIEGIGIDEFDNEGRVITLEYDDFFLINAYFPNAQHELLRIDYKLAFDRAIQDFMDKLKQKKTVLLCGDYNVAHKEIDLKNPKTNMKNPGFSPRERDWMEQFINSGYVDTFRIFNKEPDNYTWWSYRFNAREKNIGWRIDYFCIDIESKKRILNASIIPEIRGSDHCPVCVEFV